MTSSPEGDDKADERTQEPTGHHDGVEGEATASSVSGAGSILVASGPSIIFFPRLRIFQG
jgi:hypothetical protein